MKTQFVVAICLVCCLLLYMTDCASYVKELLISGSGLVPMAILGTLVSDPGDLGGAIGLLPAHSGKTKVNPADEDDDQPDGCPFDPDDLQVYSSDHWSFLCRAFSLLQKASEAAENEPLSRIQQGLKAFGSYVASLRRAKHLNWDLIANEIGKPKSYLLFLETGLLPANEFEDTVLENLAVSLDVEPSDLLRYRDACLGRASQYS